MLPVNVSDMCYLCCSVLARGIALYGMSRLLSNHIAKKDKLVRRSDLDGLCQLQNTAVTVL